MQAPILPIPLFLLPKRLWASEASPVGEASQRLLPIPQQT